MKVATFLSRHLAGLHAAGLICLSAGPAVAATPPAPAEVEAEVAAHGATATVADLTRDGMQLGSRWGWAMVGIGSGTPAWLRVAALLRRGTAGATTESLLDALSTAIRHDAPGVLALMGPTIRPEDLCRPRMADPRPIDLRVFQVHTHDAVAAVTRADLGRARDRCLAMLAADEKER